jgi:hypothetical protein
MAESRRHPGGMQSKAINGELSGSYFQGDCTECSAFFSAHKIPYVELNISAGELRQAFGILMSFSKRTKTAQP